MNTNKEVEWRRFIVPKKVEQINDQLLKACSAPMCLHRSTTTGTLLFTFPGGQLDK